MFNLGIDSQSMLNIRISSKYFSLYCRLFFFERQLQQTVWAKIFHLQSKKWITLNCLSTRNIPLLGIFFCYVIVSESTTNHSAYAFYFLYVLGEKLVLLWTYAFVDFCCVDIRGAREINWIREWFQKQMV